VRAEELEMQIRCALIVLARQIAEYRAGELTPEDQRALEYLAMVMSSLLMLAMVAAKMRAELAEHSANGAAISLCDTWQVLDGGMRYAYPALRRGDGFQTLGYYDPS